MKHRSTSDIQGLLMLAFRTVALHILIAARVVAPIGAQTTTPLPARLTDAEFRSMRMMMSEPGQSYAIEHFTSNEEGIGQWIKALTAGRDTGGAYIGVGPEQNFSYIAALRPGIAFIVDIRPEAIYQHMLYKALFELATDRADFISLLFSRPRPAGLDSTTSINTMWASFWPVAADTTRITTTLRRAIDHLSVTRGQPVDQAMRSTFHYLLSVFASKGPIVPGGGPVDSLRERLPDPSVLVVRLRDSVTGAPIPGVRVSYFCPWCGGGTSATDSSGVARSPQWARGTLLQRATIRRDGYDPVELGDIMLDRAEVSLSIGLRRNSSCMPMQNNPAVCMVFAPAGRAGAAATAGRVGGAGVAPTAPIAPSLPPRPNQLDLRRAYGGTNFASLTSAVDEDGMPRAFLGSEAAFRAVQDRHQRNMIIPLVGNFGGPKTLRAIGAYLRAHNTAINVFYVSNVESAMSGESPGVDEFYRNVATLPIMPTSVLQRWSPDVPCPIRLVVGAFQNGQRPTDAATRSAMGCAR